MYNIVLFLHILGAIIMFVAVGITLLAMISMLHSKKTETCIDISDYNGDKKMEVLLVDGKRYDMFTSELFR